MFLHICIREFQFGGMGCTVEFIEADQSYFLVEVNQVTKKTFENNLVNIVPCSSAESGYTDQTNVSSVRLHPTHGFLWKREMPST